MLTAAMKLKDTCSLEGKYDEPRQCIKKQRYWDFPGGPVGKMPSSQEGDLGLIPGQGTRSHMLQRKPI